MSNIKVLLAEDEASLGMIVKESLESRKFTVFHAENGEEALEVYEQEKPDILVLDVMMPKKDGFTLASEIRETDKKTPIVFLTAKSMKDDVINGFRLGADDYITKPFSSEELLYRIQAILKRSQPSDNRNEDQKEFVIGRYHFDYPTRILTLDTQTDKLSPKEAQLLRLFCLYVNEVLPRSIALTQIWGEDNYFTARSMDVFVTKLRKYLKRDENIEIVNIHGNGFQLLIKTNEVV